MLRAPGEAVVQAADLRAVETSTVAAALTVGGVEPVAVEDPDSSHG